jgi:sensor histidine kinase regulating citrate/malate metabolism
MDKIIEDLELSDESNVNNWSVGLQIIQIVAESHGGTIIFDSEKDRGTTFSMNLPIDSRQYIADILRSSNEPTQ